MLRRHQLGRAQLRPHRCPASGLCAAVLTTRATAQSPGKARWHWGTGCPTLLTASRSLGGVPWVQRGPSSAVRSPVRGSRGLRCGHVVWEDGCWRPQWGCLCWCSIVPAFPASPLWWSWNSGTAKPHALDFVVNVLKWQVRYSVRHSLHFFRACGHGASQGAGLDPRW